jgi:hypothetical protein
MRQLTPVRIVVAAVVIASSVAGYLAFRALSDAEKGTISGTVLVGPTCPVERDPPDPACADKPLATNLVLVSGDGAREVRKFRSDASGEFTVEIAPGSYLILSATSGPPTCDARVDVVAGQTTVITVLCDSGIR